MNEKTLPDSLLTRILEGKCVLFLGAGASISSGGVSGSDLGQYIYKSIGDVGVDCNSNLSIYTQQLVNKGFRDEIEKIVRERFQDLVPSEKFKKMAYIPWKSVYTTNYDDLVEKSYKEQNYCNCIVNTLKHENESYGRVDVKLYKINGDINTPYTSDNPLIITYEDLQDARKRRKHILCQLMKDMNDTFVFVGYSFQDENEIIKSILDELRDDERWESVKEKYVIIPEINNEVSVILNSYRVHHIKLNADDFFDYVNEKYQGDFKAKLRAIGKRVTDDNYLKGAQPRDMQYIIDCFDIYSPQREYSADTKYFYKGGYPNWGIIKQNFDIPRIINLQRNDGNKKEIKTDTLYRDIMELIGEKVKKVIIRGAVASGKSTLIYRLAYDLYNNGYFSLVYKQQTKYKEGLISTVFDITKKPFVVLIDGVFVDSTEIMKMTQEAERKNLPVVFAMSTRNTDWSMLNQYTRDSLGPFDLSVDMKDDFDEFEAERFVNNLIRCDLISANNEYEKKGFIKRIKDSHNIIDTMFEFIGSSNIRDLIGDEYDSMTPETKFAYGIISLVYRYGYKLRWEILRHMISLKYEFSWTDFIEKVLRNDARGSFSEEELQGNYYIVGRNRYICDLVTTICFKGNYSDEIDTFKKMIEACAEVDSDEKFMGGFLYSMLKDNYNSKGYSEDQIVSLLDYAIEKFVDDHTKSLIVHMKGEFLLKKHRYRLAIECFEGNINNGMNKEYSIHSLGKAYFYKAIFDDYEKNENRENSRFWIDIEVAERNLLNGVEKFEKNKYNYGMLILMFKFLRSKGLMGEKYLLDEKYVHDKGESCFGKKEYREIKKKWEKTREYTIDE